MRTFLVTGGAGFIGSSFIRHLLATHDDVRVINLDKLTYAGNLENLTDVADDPRYRFIRGDIADEKAVAHACATGVDVIVNFAAETHVDRAIAGAGDFIRTDVYGVFVLLEAAQARGVKRFVQISTDEVYGSVAEGYADEDYPLKPRNPYAASKAGGDRLAYAYFATYKVPVVITRASNNFGPNQYPEKVIPLFVTNAIENKPLPLYGDGRNVRDWLYVLDHCEAIDFLIEHGIPGEVYNIAGGNERQNVEITESILDLLGKPRSLIQYVTDRPGHDRRYALDATKLRALGWSPRHDFHSALRATVEWYVKNPRWWQRIKSGEFRRYYEAQYGRR